MPRITSLTSAPTASHTAAMAFTKLILVARKALEAYLMVSAEAGSVTINGRREPHVQRGHPHRGGLVVGADDHPVGVQEVVDRGALAQELRVRDHAHVGSAQGPFHDLGRADGDGGLVDDHGVRPAGRGPIWRAAASM